ncbi:facilitated trehalose transporter Tret1-like [Hylaeus volcanicus]|uniref:facilitated trehalose transporter Tret1-like n=1 Tax=Hylaeus volcanicus TaxID=313075 RepID=UPI0023B8074B|nr:facilitated trehalose transporter Tret1-like [Hylaeus volcanicus]
MAEEKDGVPGKYRQFFVCLVMNIPCLTYGLTIGWQSPSVPLLQDKDSPEVGEPMTDEEVSWLTGIMCLTGAFVSLGVAAIAERCGRKLSGCLATLPFAINWLLIIFATNHTHVFIARFLAGFGGAISLYIVPRYVSEISSDEIRGMLGSLLVLLLNGGIMVGYILGALLKFRIFAVTAFTIPLLYFVFIFFLPESPVYLVQHNRLYEAARSLRWLKASHEPTVQRELARLQAEAKELYVSGKSVGFSDLFRDKATIKGLVITLGLFAAQQLCGIFAMISYAETIFKISGSSLSPNTSAIILGAIQLFGSYLSTSLMERLGRRILLLTSASGMCICHYTLGIFCYLQVLEIDVSALNWIPVVMLSVYMICYSLGVGPGPYVVSSEVLARDVASMCMTLGLFVVWITAFVVVKFFTNIASVLGMYGCFFVLGTLCVAIFAFVFVLIPETKGQPRQLILDRLNGLPCSIDKTRYATSSNIIQKNAPLPEEV